MKIQDLLHNMSDKSILLSHWRPVSKVPLRDSLGVDKSSVAVA